ILPALIGRQNANRLLLAGDTFSAEEAERMGLIAYRTGVDELASEALALAQRLAEKTPAAIALTKQLTRLSDAAIKAQIEKESVLFAQRMFSEDTRERFAGFMKK
ncbi:MAG: enoyl-CoA hydratase/isomerase family protein, partial [Alcanivorax sp.]